MPDEVGEDIIQFWMENRALNNRQQAIERLKQVIFVAGNEDNKVIGISTAYKKYNQTLENNFYYMRAFVHSGYRDLDIGREFTWGIINYFEERFQNKTAIDAIGIFLEIENKFFQEHRREAILSDTGFVYIGKNERGDHLRVRYFEGAKI